MAGEPVGPFVPLLQCRYRRCDALRARASIAELLPLRLRSPARHGGTPMVRSKARNTGRGKQQRIFDPRSQPPPAFTLEQADKALLLRVRRWGQQAGQRRVKLLAV